MRVGSLLQFSGETQARSRIHYNYFDPYNVDAMCHLHDCELRVGTSLELNFQVADIEDVLFPEVSSHLYRFRVVFDSVVVSFQVLRLLLEVNSRLNNQCAFDGK